jgi:phosphonate transport system substrate-binding protein
MKKGLLLSILTIFLLILPSCREASDEQLRMVVIPTEDTLDQQNHLEPLISYLNTCIGTEIELIVAGDYTAAIQAMKYDHADIAWVGPFAYTIARREADVEPVVGGIRTSTGSASYNSIIITRVDSNIKTLRDLQGKTFAFVDPASTSGYLVPKAMLLQNNIDPDIFFSNVMYAGSHTATQLAVYNGTVDAAADSFPSFEIMSENGSINPEEMLILWKSDDIPPSPVIVQRKLGTTMIDKIKLCFVQSNVEIVSFEGSIAGFLPVMDSDYDIVRNIAETLGIEK